MRDYEFGKTIASILEKTLEEDKLVAWEPQVIKLKVTPRRGPCRFYTFELDKSFVTLLKVERMYDREGSRKLCGLKKKVCKKPTLNTSPP